MNHSTEHACVGFLNFLHSAIDSGRIPVALFLDIRKAFDSLTLGFFFGNYRILV